MISIQNASKSFGGRTLFSDASLQINSGDRFAIVGPNGCGKSTFFKIIASEMEPDSGSIQIKRGMTVGYLQQEIEVSTDTALQCALSKVFNPDPRTIAMAKQILAGLGFKNETFERPVNELSGGWAMRAELASLLLMEPDILLLDEPTNHLDLSSVEWLKEWLLSFKGSIVVISHDRDFINTICHAVVSLENQMLRVYHGDYENYVEQSELEKEKQIARWNDQQDEIKRLNDFVRRNRARMSTAARAQSALKRLDKMEIIDSPTNSLKVSINFPKPERSGHKVLSLKGVNKSYGDLKVYENLDFELERGQRLAFVGKNGAGKSTLLKMLAGVTEIDSGTRELGMNVKCGYYSQRRTEMLDPEKTVLAEALHSGRSHTELYVRTLLGAFLFRGDDVFKPTSVLSGGEKSRLALAKILLNPPNLLLLDEPTTHLDIPSVSALVGALQSYDGTLCVISHDVYFLNAVCNTVLHTEHGKLTIYPGNYDYYRSRQIAMQQEAAEAAAAAAAAPAPAQPAHKAEPQKPQNYDERKLDKKELFALNKQLNKLIEEQARLEAELKKEEVYSDYNKAARLSKELTETIAKIEAAETRILELEAE